MARLYTIMIQDFIKHFHDTGQNITDVFTMGCCYWFALILHIRFPNSTIMYDPIQNHFATMIGDRLFDITGDITNQYQVIAWEDFPDDLERKRIIKQCILFE